jgi:hypothetical protein
LRNNYQNIKEKNMGAILREGWETGGGVSASAWVQVVGDLPGVFTTKSLFTRTILPRVDLLGNGGEYFMGDGDSSDSTIEKALVRDTRELFTRVPFKVFDIGANDSYYASVVDSSNTEQVRAEHVASATAIRIRRSTTILATSSSGVAEDTADWAVLNTHIFIDDTVGFIKVYKDFDFSAPVLQFSGDTKNSTTDNFARFFRINNNRSAFDDIAVNDITLSYTSGVGAHPGVGETITGGTSSTTAIVTATFNTSGSSGTLAGTMQLRAVSGWDGDPDNDPFTTDVAITGDTNLTSATIAGGLDPNSGFPRDAFIFGLIPNGNSSSQLVGSDADSTDNYLLVDDRPMDDATAITTYVEETTTPGNRDIYELENVSARGFVAADIASIVTVELNAVAQRDGTGINNLAFVHEDVDGASGEIDSADQGLATTPEGHSELLEEASTGVDWDSGATVITKVDALRIGVKLNS